MQPAGSNRVYLHGTVSTVRAMIRELIAGVTMLGVVGCGSKGAESTTSDSQGQGGLDSAGGTTVVGDGGAAANGSDSSAAEHELAWEGPTLVDEDEFVASSPKIFVDAHDSVWFVMLRQVSDAHEVHARQYGLATKAWSKEIRIDSGSGDASALLLDSAANGDAIVAWQDKSVSGEVSIRAASYASDAEAWTDAGSLATTKTEAFLGLQVACSPVGGGVVTWAEQSNEPASDPNALVKLVHTALFARTLADGSWGAVSTVWQSDDDFVLALGKPVFADATRAWVFFSWNSTLSAVSSGRDGWAQPIAVADGNTGSVAAVPLASGGVQALAVNDGSVFASYNAADADTWSATERIESITPQVYNVALAASPSGSPGCGCGRVAGGR